jgi:hypothetical protein
MLSCFSSVKAANFEEAAWRAAYESELRCDPLGVRNALMRLKDYQRFHFLTLSRLQEEALDRALARLVLPKRPAPVIAEDKEILPRKSVKPRRRQKKARSGSEDAEAVSIDTNRIKKELLTKAKEAYQFARLQEAQRLFRLALKLDPRSSEAKKGLEKVELEMN